MPVEIKELYLKVNVNEGPRERPNGAQSTDTCSQSTGRRDEALIQACVDRVLKIIAQKTQR